MDFQTIHSAFFAQQKSEWLNQFISTAETDTERAIREQLDAPSYSAMTEEAQEGFWAYVLVRSASLLTPSIIVALSARLVQQLGAGRTERLTRLVPGELEEFSREFIEYTREHPGSED